MFVPDSEWTVIEAFGCKIRVDLITTRKAYETKQFLLGDKCKCEHCRNLVIQLDDAISDDLKSELAQLGIDYHKPDDSCGYGQDHQFFYMISYIIRGRILHPEYSEPPYKIECLDKKNGVNVSPGGMSSLSTYINDRLVEVSYSFWAPWLIDEPYQEGKPWPPVAEDDPLA